MLPTMIAPRIIPTFWPTLNESKPPDSELWELSEESLVVGFGESRVVPVTVEFEVPARGCTVEGPSESTITSKSEIRSVQSLEL